MVCVGIWVRANLRFSEHVCTLLEFVIRIQVYFAAAAVTVD